MTINNSNTVDMDLVKKICDAIPSEKKENVQFLIIKIFVDNMPGKIVYQLTGEAEGFEKAEEILMAFYTEQPFEETISDGISLLGAATFCDYLDNLNITDE